MDQGERNYLAASLLCTVGQARRLAEVWRLIAAEQQAFVARSQAHPQLLALVPRTHEGLVLGAWWARELDACATEMAAFARELAKAGASGHGAGWHAHARYVPHPPASSGVDSPSAAAAT